MPVVTGQMVSLASGESQLQATITLFALNPDNTTEIKGVAGAGYARLNHVDPFQAIPNGLGGFVVGWSTPDTGESSWGRAHAAFFDSSGTLTSSIGLSGFRWGKMVLGEDSILLVTHGTLPGVYGSAADRHVSIVSPQGYWMGSSDVLQGDLEVSSAIASKGGGFLVNYSDGEFVAIGSGGAPVIDVSPAGPNEWIGASPFPASGVRDVTGDVSMSMGHTAWPQTAGIAGGGNRAAPRYYVVSPSQSGVQQRILIDHYKMLSRELAAWDGNEEYGQFGVGFCYQWLFSATKTPSQPNLLIAALITPPTVSFGHGVLWRADNPQPNPQNDVKMNSDSTLAITFGQPLNPFLITFNDDGPYFKKVPGISFDGRPRYQRLVTSLHELGHARQDILVSDGGDTALSAKNDEEVIYRCGALMKRIDDYPAVKRVSLDDGPVGGRSVNLEGKGFVAGVKAFVGDVEATVQQVVDFEHMQVMLPAGTLGKKDVKVVNASGEWGTLYEGFKYK